MSSYKKVGAKRPKKGWSPKFYMKKKYCRCEPVCKLKNKFK